MTNIYAVYDTEKKCIAEYLPETGLCIYKLKLSAEKLKRRWNRLAKGRYKVIKYTLTIGE